ncbi:MAG: hypothetical protein RSD14_04965 [Clostridia bacterium]
MKELLESYNIYKADIKYKEYEIRKLELEEASPSSSNLSINSDIRAKRKDKL